MLQIEETRIGQIEDLCKAFENFFFRTRDLSDDDQVTGFLTPKNDIDAIVEKITTLLNNKELRRSMGAAGLKKFNQNYTLHFFEQNIKEITDKILNAK